MIVTSHKWMEYLFDREYLISYTSERVFSRTYEKGMGVVRIRSSPVSASTNCVIVFIIRAVKE